MTSVNRYRADQPQPDMRAVADKPPGRGTSARSIDPDHLARRTLGDAALEREVLGLFLARGEIFMTRLRTARTAESWWLAARAIKGSARDIGAW